MMNFKEHETLIRDEVKKIDAEDPNWKWSVKGVGKNKVSIRWGYLDYLEESNNCFYMKLKHEESDEDNEMTLTTEYPDNTFMNVHIVVEGRALYGWQENFENAIRAAINEIADTAMSRY